MTYLQVKYENFTPIWKAEQYIMGRVFRGSDMIRELKKFEDDRIEEAQSLLTDSSFDDLQSSNQKSKLENEFEGADEATQAKIVEQYFLRTQV